jgi:hypothetical protein
MEEFLKIATIVVVAIGILAGVAFVYVIRILRNIAHVSQRVAEASDNIWFDLEKLRTSIRKVGAKMKHFVDFFGNIVQRNIERRNRSKDVV